MSSNKPDHDRAESAPGLLSRREVLVALAGAGALAGGAVAASSKDGVGIGGGPMSDSLSHRRSEVYRVPSSEVPDQPQTAGRFFYVTESDDGSWSVGDLVEDDGSVIQKVDLGVQSVSADASFNADNGFTTRLVPTASGYAAHGRNGELASGEDAATVMQGAIDAFADTQVDGTGQELRVTRGIYSHGQTVALDDGSWLVGEGMRASAIEAADGLNANLFEYLADDSLTDRDYFSGFKDLNVWGNKSGNTSGHGLHVVNDGTDDDPNDMHIERVMWHKCAGDGMRFDYIWGLHIKDALFETHAGDGLNLSGGGQYYLTDLFIAYNGGNGITADGALNGRGKGVHSYQNGGHGFQIRNKSYSTWSSCHAVQNDGQGWLLDASGPQRITLQGCHSAENGQNSAGTTAGFYISNSDVTLQGCRAYDMQTTPTQDFGFYINSSDVRVIGGVATGNGTSDIRVTSSGVEAELWGVEYGSLDDFGTRTMINGRSTNDGNPSLGGQWNTHHTTAYEKNIRVRDTTNGVWYIPTPTGWENMNTTAA